MKSYLLNPITCLLIVTISLVAPLRTEAQIGLPRPSPLVPPQSTNPNQLVVPDNSQTAPSPSEASTTTNGSTPEKMVTVQFPHTSALDILSTYELLTGKKTVRDSNLTGPELSINVAEPIPLHEAVALIESSLLLNGYTIIPVDDKTVKILGPTRPPRTESLPLYVDASELPEGGDKLVSFYKPLRFLNPDEAISIIENVIQTSAYTSLVAVPNTGAIIITEKSPVIRKILDILDVIDKEPSQIITEFVPLERANAQSVVDTLTTMFGNSSSGSGGIHPVSGQPQGNQGASISSGGDLHLLSGKPQFIADKRTNRVLIVVKADNYKYLRELIAKLDLPSDAAQPLIRPLNYAQVSDVYSVLITMLQSKDDNGSGQPGQAGAAPTPQPTPRQTQNNNSGGTNSGTGDSLEDSTQESPESTIIGSTSIFTDPSANSIVVYGPPDVKTKAKEIIDLLDQRPKQVYLAAVIGQLQLTEGVDYGASWFAKISQGGSNSLIGAAVNNTFSGLLTNLVTSSLTNAINNFPSSLGGLTVYGTVAQGLATYAHFLESSGRFRTLSRPVVYTSNNKAAFISSGQKVPVPSTTLTSTTPGLAGSSTSATVDYQDVSLSLSVIPLINSDHEVNLQIIQENNTLGAYVNIGGNSVPNVNTQTLKTTVRVPSGSTIVLGGLISDDKQLTKTGIPYISKIPILGPLLGGDNNKQRTRNELVVMIQPIVVDDNASMQQASDAEGGTSDLGKKSTELQNHLQPSPTPSPKKRFHLFSLPKIDNF